LHLDGLQRHLSREVGGKFPVDKTILGFDIGGSKIAIIEGDFDAHILQRQEVVNRADLPFEAAFHSMCEAGETLITAARKTGRSPSAVSVSVGGPLDIEAGIIKSPPNLPLWHGIHLKEKLFSRFGLPTFVEHDGNAGALAEFTFGAGRGTKNLIFLTVGTGLGAGIILNGRLYRGSTDSAGEVGHIRIADQGPVVYGRAGSWEGLCSASGLGKLAPMRFPERWPEEISPSEVIESALADMPEACSLIEEMGTWLGRGLSILVDLLNPEMIVIGTLGVVLGEMLLAPARRVLAEEALPLPVSSCQIVPAQLGDRLGDIAALMAAIMALPTNAQQRRERTYDHEMLRGLWDGMKLRESTIEELSSSIQDTAQTIIEALQQGHKVLVFGNGGSAADAQHFAGELLGRYHRNRQPLPAISLSADTSVGTCISNDYGFDEIFARQVRALAEPGDVVIGISTSGRSENILRAFDVAREMGAASIALTGETGLQDEAVDFTLSVPSRSTARIQEEHTAIIHCWCEAIDRAFADKT
jgi:glucokinase